MVTAGSGPHPAALQERVGTVLRGKWRIDRLLGSGGMASVYEATHRNNKRVAIKMLHHELSANLGIRQRFLREGYVANSVGRAGAVSVDDDDVTDDGCAFLVMELLDGETLDARWERKGRRIDALETLAAIDQVLDTLAVAHEKGIVHRDIKPENLFLTVSGQVKILDFGIAQIREFAGSAGQTQSGTLMGTPNFMPPEQARGLWEQVDGVSDLWAVGATMFTLLTGRYVHASSTINEALIRTATEPAPSVGSFDVDLPAEVVELVDRALAFERDRRWSDARAMQSALREAYATLTNKPISLLDAIAVDPVNLRDASGAATAHGLTTTDGMSASAGGLGPTLATIGSSRRVRITAAVAVFMMLVGALWAMGARPSSPPIPTSVTAAESRSPPTPPQLATGSDAGAPVISVEQLPLASTSAVSRFEPRPSAVAPAPSSKPNETKRAASNAAATNPKPVAVEDPFAARR